MGSTTTRGYPYPVGTDRVMDGDNAMQSLAEAVDGDALVTLAVCVAGNQNIPASTVTAVNWAAASENGCALTKTNNFTWTTTLAGFYLISYQIRLVAAQPTRGFTDLYAGNRIARSVFTTDGTGSVTLVTRLNAGELIKCEVFGATATTVHSNANGTGTWLTVMRLGRIGTSTVVP